MKRLKKFMMAASALFVLSLVMTFTMKAEAAEMEAAVAGEASVNLMNTPEFGLNFLNPETGQAGVSVANQGLSYTRVGIFDVNGNLVVYDDCIRYASFSGLAQNQVYYYKVQTLDNDKQPTSDWSAPRAFATISKSKIKLKAVKNKRVIVIKVPKINGIKNYTISMSKKSDGKFKKVKTLKPGKKLTISKFKKKSLKNGTYYIKVEYKTRDNIKCDDFKMTYVYFYTTYR